MKRLKDLFLVGLHRSLEHPLFVLRPVSPASSSPEFCLQRGSLSSLERLPWSQTSLPRPFGTFLSVGARIAMYEIVIQSQRHKKGNHSPMPTSFFQLESLMWSS